MGVPGHDERDFAFALKFDLPIRQVIAIDPQHASARPSEPFETTGWQDWYADKQHGVCVNSGELDGLGYVAAVDRVAQMLSEKGLGEKKTTWRLRDWGISRQRYWGTPIPIIHCEDCGAVPVPYEQLPVVLPDDLVPDGSGNPLNKDERFLRCACPKCGKPSRRETYTMDTFIDSSWYYMRYCSPDNHEAMVDGRNDYWMPMDQYIGGIEHAVLHLLYARFWTKVMRDLGLVDLDEPFANLFTQGMVLNHIYSQQPATGRRSFFNPADVDVVDEAGEKRYIATRPDGSTLEVRYDGLGTMSKSKNNGVDPQSLVEKFGADTARLFMMFASPPEQTLEWSDEGVQGSFRFLRRLWKAVHEHVSAGPAPAIGEALASGPLAAPQKALRRAAHQTLAKVTDDIGRRRTFNTAVAAVMELLNAISRFEDRSATGRAVVQEALEIAVIALSPMVPHITHALWAALGHDTALVDVRWPSADVQALVQDEITLAVQVNGKLRSQISVSVDADEAAVRALALADDMVRRFVGEATPKRVIVVPRKLVNVVV
jgi:leucyl-tRNA synthetase